jgi:hypothetical protein
MSALGHSRPIHSAPVLTNVRFVPLTTKNDAARRKVLSIFKRYYVGGTDQQYFLPAYSSQAALFPPGFFMVAAGSSHGAAYLPARWAANLARPCHCALDFEIFGGTIFLAFVVLGYFGITLINAYAQQVTPYIAAGDASSVVLLVLLVGVICLLAVNSFVLINMDLMKSIHRHLKLIVATIVWIVGAAVVIWMLAAWHLSSAPPPVSGNISLPPWAPKPPSNEGPAWFLIFFTTIFPAWWLTGRLYSHVAKGNLWDTLLKYGVFAVLWVICIWAFITVIGFAEIFFL